VELPGGGVSHLFLETSKWLTSIGTAITRASVGCDLAFTGVEDAGGKLCGDLDVSRILNV